MPLFRSFAPRLSASLRSILSPRPPSTQSIPRAPPIHARPRPQRISHPNIPQSRTYRIPHSPRYHRFSNSRAFVYRWSQSPTFYYQVVGLATVVGGFYVYNLETVPVSGRRRFNIVTRELELDMGRQMFEGVMRDMGGRVLPEWDPRTRRVKGVLERLIPNSGLDVSGKGGGWEVRVIEAPEANAFVIPGGKVFVFTGILPICETDDGLAAVLGHEIAHNVAHHAAERMSQMGLFMPLIWFLDLFVGIPGAASNVLLQLGFGMPGSRRQEAEADYIGLMMMARSCYDPEAAIALWARMQEKEGKHAVPQFLSTHPSSYNRQEKMREWLEEARDKRAQSDCAPLIDFADQFRTTFVSQRW
ncbi:hypothetical protein M501DRAFT_1059624 [Patellaria atrata CBS 101060]|uniref:Peptidase M48 domain-containing protein n=1 Tax=Patellaria atrata CBS 101060 TaxID=1346257 RepID=A0A9P4VQN1_9PEZI|nr:hypothetical protein M501DRAFT_1059624 [Patellaria atrata CBS 101060]